MRMVRTVAVTILTMMPVKNNGGNANESQNAEPVATGHPKSPSVATGHPKSPSVATGHPK